MIRASLDETRKKRLWPSAAATLALAGMVLFTSGCSSSDGDVLNDPPVAKTIIVNSTEDLSEPSAGTMTLRAAIAAAEEGEKIVFAPELNGETITLTLVADEHSILKGETYSADMRTFLGYGERDYGRSALYARKNLVIDASALPDGITLEWGGGEASHARVMAVYGNLTMKNLGVRSGFSSAESLTGGTQPYTLARGGGLAVWGTVTLENCSVSGNRVEGDATASRDRGAYGGGIYANGLNLKNCIVSGNSASGYGAGGGGIYSVGGADNSGGVGNDAILERCTVSGNRVTAQHAYGGGIFTLAGGPLNLAWLRLTNCTVARNLVEDNPALPESGQYYYRGGGIYMGGGSLALSGCTVVENEVNGTLATFSDKPNMGGGGVCATIGNAHVVEDVTVQHSIVAGNRLNGAAADWYAGSLLNFFSRGYNRFGSLDFSQILVPVPDWTDLSRKHYPKAGDQDGVPLDQLLDVSAAARHPAVLSAGTDAGEPAVLWYPPSGGALDQIPVTTYAVTSIAAGYEGFGINHPDDDFLNQVLLKLRADHASELGADFGASFADLTGTSWYGPAETWPTNTANAPWIKFWRDLDAAIDGRLGMVGLGDEFWGSFTNGPLGNVDMSVTTRTAAATLAAFDQLGRTRPIGAKGDIGAVEKIQ